jgi:predicted transcriptional regulator
MTAADPLDRWYTAVACPVPECVLTATHRHPEYEAGLADAERGELTDPPSAWTPGQRRAYRAGCYAERAR